MVLGLSAALMAPPDFAGPITSGLAVFGGLGALALKKTMASANADVSLVSEDERRRFLIEHTAWLAVGLVAGVVVLAFIYIRLSFPLRVGLGHAALLVSAGSFCLASKAALAHQKRVILQDSRR